VEQAQDEHETGVRYVTINHNRIEVGNPAVDVPGLKCQDFMSPKDCALLFIVIDLLSIQSGNPGGHIAHLGGALWGFIYGFSLKSGNDIYKILYRFKLPKFTWNKKQSKYSTSRPKSGRPISDLEYNKKRAATQEEIDYILDKISKSGYSSLSSKEKELLFKTSNKK